jgi:hypothetical protein
MRIGQAVIVYLRRGWPITRFALSWLLMVLACLLLAEGFSFKILRTDLILPVVVSALVTTTIAWQWRMLGEPNKLRCAVGHFLFFCGLAILIARLGADPADESFNALVAVTKVLDYSAKMLGIIPDWLLSVMRSPALAITFIAVSLALSLKWPTSGAVLGLITFLGIAIPSFSSEGPVGTFILGLACFAASFLLQYRRPEVFSFWNYINQVWGGSPIIRGDFHVAHAILNRAILQNGELSEKQVFGIIKNKLGRNASSSAVSSVGKRVLLRLVDDGIVEVKYSTGGPVLFLSRKLMETRADGWTMAAVLPRAIIVGIVALIWVLSPIDLIPDSIPIFGVLDDSMITLLGGKVFFDALSQRRIKNQDSSALGYLSK